ncbi:GATA transcription factor 26-like [Cucurbita moschata]|uniref:GATA transcription factor 26-like n=1 Tax=Cucurbita moschata TaxID=3662 RepID=A0A6J1H4K8_CUCMO|nr:GATA transcription factor 26-like [Cucurbita moschata]
MGKHGPCCHCGVTSTPLWRNGPPDKPVLCNACGSRWRTKGTLVNYTPLHARADPDEYENHRVKSISINKNKEVKLLKRKLQQADGSIGWTIPDQSQGYYRVVDEDTSNRSSSGSAISNPESCAHFSSADASDLTGPAQSIVWEAMVPSRKRTCVNRPKQSPVEKLTKDLYGILCEQRSSYFSEASEEDLLFESEKPMVSVEIGHGSILIRHPSSIAREEESEASSVSVDHKQYLVNEVYSPHSATVLVCSENKGMNFPPSRIGKMKNPSGSGVQQVQIKRDDSHHESAQILGSHNSPLCDVDINDIINFGEFVKQLTNEEQQQLMKYLPQIDIAELPETLKSMFDSPYFKESLTSFQQLLREGVFDASFLGTMIEDCTTLKRLVLCNSSKSKWVERYHQLKKRKNDGEGSFLSNANTSVSSNFMNVKRLRESYNQNVPEVKTIMKSPKRLVMKENKNPGENDGSCFSPRSLFALPTDGSFEYLQFIERSSDQDLLLDVRSNNSFPQAELLHPTSRTGGRQASTCSSSVHPNLVHH